MSKILILANHYNTLRIFRRELIKKLAELGNEVIISIPPAEKQEIDKLKVEIALTNKELDMFRNETRKKLEELETRMKIITMAITTLSAEQNDTREIVLLLVKEVGTMGNRENK